MVRRRRLVAGLVLTLAVLSVTVVASIAALPHIVRRVAIARLQATTGRAVEIQRVDLDIFSGRLAVRGFRLADADGKTPLADFEHLDGRIHLPSLLTGHVWIRELMLRNSHVRVIRVGPGEFNISALLRRRGAAGGRSPGGRPPDVTIDRFELAGGTVTLEDRVLTPARIWTSDQISIQATNVSTRTGNGYAVATSITAGAPVVAKVDNLRLYPIHVRTQLTMQGVDLSLLRLYMPPDLPIAVDRGRLDATLNFVLDARDGIQLHGNARVENAVVVRPGDADPVLTSPTTNVAVDDLTVVDGSVRLRRVSLTGRGTLFDRRVKPAARHELQRLRASAEGLTWPVTSPARIEIASDVPGGGELDVRGTVQMQPPSARVRVRLTGAELAAWSQFIPARGRISGTATADLDVSASLGEKVAARAAGTAAISNLAVAHEQRRLIRVDRINVAGIGWEWPSRMSLDHVEFRRPAAIFERDREGQIEVMTLLSPHRAAAAAPAAANAAKAENTAASPQITIGVIRIEDGTVTWRDAAVRPAAGFDVTGIEVAIRGGTWPVRGPVWVDGRARMPGGGELSARGSVQLEPVAAQLRVALNGADLGPYQSYLPVRARIAGRGTADLTVLARASPLQAGVAGRADVSRILIAEDGRPVLRATRVHASGIAVDWPGRVAIERLSIQRPSALIERRENGEFPVRTLLAARSGPLGARQTGGNEEEPSPRTVAMQIGELTVTDGNLRFVDATVAPIYAEEVSRLNGRIAGITTDGGKPATLAFTGRIGAGTLALEGRVTPSATPLHLDVTGRVRDFGVPRVNSYLQAMTAWTAREGRLSADVQCRIKGDELDARTWIQLTRLKLERAGQHDEARRRIGLPLGLLVALMKNSKGEINLSLPIGGRLNDPRFAVREAMWGAVRTVAVKTVAAPVSWIGRVDLDRDSRIADISINPVPFMAGATALTTSGTVQVGRLAAFMRQSTDVKMVLTPIVTLGDIEELKRDDVRAEIERVRAEVGIPLIDAATRVFEKHFPGRRPPKTMDEIVVAVSADYDPPEAAALRLASQRADAVRSELKKTGIDAERLQVNKDVEALESMDGGHVEFLLTDQVKPRRNLLVELLRKLKSVVRRAAGASSPEHVLLR